MKIIGFRLALAAGAVLALSACTQSELRISPDFGDAMRENVAAQIADPDAHYAGVPAPGASNGARVGLAQSRYERNQVIEPSSTTASNAASIGNAENGASPQGAGASAGAGTAAPGP
jgi:hypothetical protein